MTQYAFALPMNEDEFLATMRLVLFECTTEDI